MKINIASSHRFHLLDLARELDKQGFDVRFYSYVPSSRCERYGLPKGKSRCMLWFLWPFFVFARLLPKADWVTKWRNVTMDYALSWFMRPCDVYIALGTVYLHSFDAAKKKFGAKTIMEWGSKHVDEQQRILASVGAHLNKEYFNERSRKGYDVVDFISIASDHVERSFIERGIPNDKLLKNPYGVDLKDFYPMNNLNRDYDFIMVGNWGLQKGCDLIVEAIRSTGYSFLHVGSIVGDVPFPKEKNFKHHDKVDQKELVNYYNQAKIMLFPSRQDGFGMVLSQALSCNLPIVGSSDCGAPDLKRMVELPEYITIITEHTPQAVIEAMSSALEQYKKLEGRVYAGNAIDELTWKSYSERYSNYLSINALLGGAILRRLYYKYDLIMVGGWSLRKGCDLLARLVETGKYTLLHVGSMVDMQYPDTDCFTHIDSVDQKELVRYYNKAKVFILPSREEGLAMVQAQAICCNLPIVGSLDSGAEDLKRMVEAPENILIIPEHTLEAVAETVKSAMLQYSTLSGKIYAGKVKDELSWNAYGKRYAGMLRK